MQERFIAISKWLSALQPSRTRGIHIAMGIKRNDREDIQKVTFDVQYVIAHLFPQM